MILLLPLVIGAALIAALAMLGRWFVNANPTQLAQTLRSGSGFALIGIGAFLIIRGQALLGFGLIMAGLAKLGVQGAPNFGGRPGRARRSGGQASTVRTARVEATLDHDTGEMDGQVLAGRHEGRRFAEMSDTQLLEVWADCGRDEESRLIVEAYLDRRHPEWREGADADGNAGPGGPGSAPGGDGARPSGAMTEEDAYEVLGLQRGASEAEIRAAHRRLMKQMHPDQGGSTFFAAKLNEAKDVLLRRR